MTKKLVDCTPEQQAKMRTDAALYRIRVLEKRKLYGAAYHKHKYATDPAYRAKKDASANRARIKKRYGLTEEQLQAKLVAQGYRCAICNIKLEHFHTDHCHKTGKTRDLLCTGCNVFLGKVEHSPDRLRAVLAYIERHK